MCNIDQAIRGVVGNGPLDGLKNAGEDLSKGVTAALGGIEQGLKNPLKDIEQAISGGKGWSGALDNVGKVGSAMVNPLGTIAGEVLKNSTGMSIPGLGGGFNPLGDLGKGLGDLAGGAGNMINGMTGGAANMLGDAYNAVSNSIQPGGVVSNIEQAVTSPFKGADNKASVQAQGWDPLKDINNGIKGVQDTVSKTLSPIEQTITAPFKPGGAVSNLEQAVTSPFKGNEQAAQTAQQGQPAQNGVDWGGVLSKGADLAGNYLGAQAQADVARRAQDMQANAYKEMMARSKEGEGQFLDSLGQNPQLEGMKKDLQDMNNQVVGRQQNMINQQLGRAGVKGGQAANLYGRQIGELQQNGMRDVNKLAYEDAANKANQKSTYFANKGQSGFNLVPKYS